MNDMNTKVYLVGAGIASLASAAYLIMDSEIPAGNIRILEETGEVGGSMDAHGSAETGYTMRGGRMFDEEAYTCTYHLLSLIPGMRDPSKSVKEEIFLVRGKTDRPPVIPKGSVNLAFIGQYCEIPDDTVFTVEYSIRSAQTAVFSLLKLDKKASPIYKGQHDSHVLYNSVKALLS